MKLSFERVAAGLSRNFRNTINAVFGDIENNFKETDTKLTEAKSNADSASVKSDQALSKAENVQSQVDVLVIGSNTSPAETVQARVDEKSRTFDTVKQRIDTGFTEVTAQLAENATEINFINDVIVNVKKFGAIGDKIANDTQAIQSAIDYVYNLGGGEVHFPIGTYLYNQTLVLPDKVSLIGKGDVTNSSVLHFTGTGFSVVTGGLHQRNRISDLKIDTNGNGGGIRFGDIATNLPGVVPVIFSLSNISITNVRTGFNAIELINVSHMDMIRVKTGFGSAHKGGTALKIWAESYNSGVINATGCTFGRVDYNYTGLEIESNINLDCYVFDSCYFGGERPIRLVGTNYLRSVNFIGCHVEARKLTGSVATELIGVEVGNVLGGSWTGGTITAFGGENSSGFVFTDRTKKFNVFAVEANALTEAVYKNKGATILEDCILQAGNLSNSSTATQYVGIPDNNFMFEQNRFTTQNIRTKYLYREDGLNKEYWASSINKTLPHTRGDIIKNTVPYPAKNITHWKCETSGTSSAKFIAYGTGWGTTAEKNALTLTADDKGYWYKNTETASLQMWDGTAWI